MYVQLVIPLNTRVISFVVFFLTDFFFKFFFLFIYEFFFFFIKFFSFKNIFLIILLNFVGENQRNLLKARQQKSYGLNANTNEKKCIQPTDK